jgi:gliding motility-associated protein GldE
MIILEDADFDPLISIFSFLLFSFENIPWNVVISLFVIIFLFAISAMISGSETAFFSLNTKILDDPQKDKRKIELIKELLERPKHLLAIILITNNFVNVAIVVLTYYFLNDVFHIERLNVYVQFLLEVVLITSLILLIGEIIPKIFAAQKPYIFAGIMARPLKLLSKILRPLSHLLVSSTNLIDQSLKKKKKSIDKEELSEAIALSTDDSKHQQERKMLEDIVKFSDIEVSEVMKSRVDMIAIDSSAPYEEVLQLIIKSGYSRIPVYKESLDQIEGILVTKTLLQHLDKDEKFNWTTLIHDPIFVPETKKISALLEELREKKIHLAIVVDEYGGTMGLITMEDIIEEIIGDFYDEKDLQKVDVDYQHLDENTYIFEGKTHLLDFLKILKIKDDYLDEIKKESDTIAGLLLENLGVIPEKKAQFTYKNLKFEVISVDKRRIKKIKVSLHKDEK